MYQPPLTWTRFQQKTGLINTIILLRHIGPYKVLQGKLAAQQLIVHILIFHHYINLDTASIQPAKFLPVFQAWNLQDWSYESTNTNLTGLFTTFERFEFVKESFAGPFRENNFLFLLLYGATFVFVCAYVCVCVKQRQCLAKDGSISKLEPALFQRHNSSKVIPHSSFWVCPRRRDYMGSSPGVCFNLLLLSFQITYDLLDETGGFIESI